MNSSHFFKAGVMAIALVITFVICWETYLRLNDFKISYNDDDTLWADKRAQVYENTNTSTVIVGSSRVKFDIDIRKWEELTGENAVQLSIQGTSPIPMLEDLANDEKFKGKLIVGITEGLFFSYSDGKRKSLAEKRIQYFKDQTPTQKFSFILNRELESGFVLLQENSFALNALLDDLKIPNRPGVFGPPPFPKAFTETNFERQSVMTEKFLSDTILQHQVKGVWTMFGAINKKPGVSGDTLENIFKTVKAATDKIRARGGRVIFVRPPSSGPVREAEKANWPRELYWDKLLSYTGCEGIHFEDYSSISSFVCPEWSHLTPKDGIVFTEELIGVLNEKGWSIQTTVTPSTKSLSQQ